MDKEKALRVAFACGLRYRFCNPQIYHKDARNLWSKVLEGEKVHEDTVAGDMFAYIYIEMFKFDVDDYEELSSKFLIRDEKGDKNDNERS